MSTFIKAQASSVICTVFDFFITIVFKEVFKFWYVAASAIGTIAGGMMNFALGRRWVFNGRDKKVPKQLIKYLITWTGNLLLTTLGVFFFTHYLGLSYIVSKVITAIIIGIGYNYMLQKKFVFA